MILDHTAPSQRNTVRIRDGIRGFPGSVTIHLKKLNPVEWMRVDGNSFDLTNGKRGNPNRLLISESGLYKLIMRSDKPGAPLGAACWMSTVEVQVDAR